MPNHRPLCPICRVDVLQKDFGNHIVKKHEEVLFDTSNPYGAANRRHKLHKDKYINKPLELTVGDYQYFFCFADNSCIKNEINADNHFKGKLEKHKEVIYKLRDKYPVTESDSSAEPSKPLLTAKDTSVIQSTIVELLTRLRTLEKKELKKDEDFDTFSFSKKELLTFSKINVKLDDESLKELYPNLFEEPEPEVKVEPEPEPEVKVEPEPAVEPVVTKPKSMWEVFVFQNPELKTLQQQITAAREMGLPIPPEIAHPQTAARPITVPPPTTTATQPDLPKIIFTTKVKRVQKAVTS